MESEKDIFEQWAEERASRNLYQRTLDRLLLWWNFKGQYTLSSFKIGIKNLVFWLPIIWRDRNWDQSYIFNILKHKLKAQAHYIGSMDRHTRAKRDAEHMLTCVRLIDKIIDDYYGLEFTDYEKIKNWFEDVPDSPGHKTWECIQVEEHFDKYFEKYPLIYKRVVNKGEGLLEVKDTSDKQRIASNIAQINQDRANRLLFKIIENNINSWWD